MADLIVSDTSASRIPLPEELAALMNHTLDTAAMTEALSKASSFVAGYTRGRGFTDGVPAGDLADVIVTSAARLYHHKARHPIGDSNYDPGGNLAGWTLPELAVLNGYRRRAA